MERVVIVQIRVKKKKKKDGQGEGERAKKRERWLRLCVLVCLMALRLLSAAAEAEICSRSNQMKLNECFSFTKTSRQTFFFIIITIFLTHGLAWFIKNESRLYRSHPVSHCQHLDPPPFLTLPGFDLSLMVLMASFQPCARFDGSSEECCILCPS